MERFVVHAALAALLALAACAPVSAAGCALADSHAAEALVSFRGQCRNGHVHGNAEIIFTRSRNGQERRAKQFGWFQDGEAQGIHALVMPTADAPAFAALVFYRDGKPQWTFALSGANWPKAGNLVDANGLWEDVDGEAAQGGVDYPSPAGADGMVRLDWLLYRITEFPLAEGVQSADKEALDNFLRHLPIDKPLAALDIERPGGAIFADTAPEPPVKPAKPAKPGASKPKPGTKPAAPAKTPSVDELIRRAMGKGT